MRMPTGDGVKALVLGIVIGIALGAALATLVYERELGRLTRLLRMRGPRSNERLTVQGASRGMYRLAEAVNDQLDSLQREQIDTQRREREFRHDLASLSHDIRTPLAGAKGYLQLAGSEEDKAEKGGDLDAAMRRIDDTRSLLDQLFSYTKASDPDARLTLKPHELGPLVAETLMGHYPEFEARGWEPQVRLEEGGAQATRVLTDAASLRRVFDNLTANALRHGSGSPTITQDGATVTFSNPIPADADLDPTRLFERFYRADGARGGGGSGLGLSVAAALVHAMGGDIRARLENAEGGRKALAIEVRLRTA